ncbi:MAG: alpha/beta hydrolase, partial [Proteobacteria bacterium]|nr:alpha/beta hydrolase [Pseudomonadota bacterium]
MKNLLAPIGTICVCSIFLGCTQESLIFFPETLPRDYPFSFSEPFEEVNVPVEAATLNALLFKAQNKGADFKSVPGVVLYFHGNAGSLRSWGGVAGDFTSRGYDILIPDYRGFGKSTGDIANEK